MTACNCENANCPHGGGDPSGAKWKPCPNQGEPQYRVMYIGAVCKECYDRMDPQYQLSPRTSS